MRRARRRAPWLVVALLGLGPVPATGQALLDDLLRWDGPRHGDLGPTGRRLFAEHLETAPGLRGRFGYGRTTPGFVDPLTLQLRCGGEDVELASESETWFPSHLHAVWRGDGLRLEERKFITDDDTLVDVVRLTNTGSGERDLEFLLGGAMTPLRERYRSRQIPLQLPAGLAAAPAGLPVGALEADSVHYEGAPVPVPRGDPGEAIVFDVPDVSGAVAQLHLLCWCAPGAAPDGRPPAVFELRLDDGTRPQVDWPPAAARIAHSWLAAPRGPGEGAAGRTEWRFLRPVDTGGIAMQLSYSPPPGRFLHSVTLRRGPGPGAAALIGATLEIPPREGRLPVLVGRPDFHGLPVFLTLAGDGFTYGPPGMASRVLGRTAVLQPGETLEFRAAVASGRRPFVTALRALDLAQDEGLFTRHVATWTDWFVRNVPGFTCSDPLLERAWQYGWFVVRHSMLRLDLPDFDLPVFYAGLSDERHTRLPLASAPFVLREVRWLRDPSFAQGHLRALLRAPSPDGRLRSVYLGGTGDAVPHWLGAAVLDAWMVHPARPFLAEAVPLLARDLAVTLEQSEGQPSPHAASCALLSARALARSQALLGDVEGAEHFEALSVRFEATAPDPLVLAGPRAGLEAVPDDPVSLCLEIEQLARALRAPDAAPGTRALLSRRLRAYTALQCEGGGLNGFHASHNDLLIRLVGGLVPRTDGTIELWPLVHDLDHFAFQDIPYRGRNLDISWNRSSGRHARPEVPEGFALSVDGARVFHVSELRRMVVEEEDLAPVRDV